MPHPPVLYKYVKSPHAVIALAKGSLRFTQITDLNDPAELVSFVNANALSSSLEHIRQHGFTENQFQWLCFQKNLLDTVANEFAAYPLPLSRFEATHQIRNHVYDNVAAMENWFVQVVNTIRQRVGVLSLTERWDSLPMWAHYADLARGFVVRFSNLDQDFAGGNTGSLDALKPVRYLKEFIGMTHDPTTQDNLFFDKLYDWQYEAEWRVVKPLSHCELSRDRTMYISRIASERITGVLCGWNVSHESLSIVRNGIAELQTELQIYRAIFDQDRVRCRPMF